MKNSNVKSMVMFISSMLIFGTIGIFRRNIPIQSSMLACIRGLVGSTFLLLFVKIKGIPLDKKIDKKNLSLLVISGILIGLNWILLFEAYNYTTVPIATLCYYMEPTIVILLAAVLFSEKLTGKKIACTLIAIVGMLFVSGLMEQKATSSIQTKGILFGLSAAVLYSTVVLINKAIKVDDAYLKTIIQLFSASIILLPYVLVTNPISNIRLETGSIVMILVVGVVHTGIAYALYFASMKNLKAQTIAVFSYIDPVSSLVFSSIFLSERMTIFGIIGAVFIIGSALVISKE